jgi:tetratricopeptide (TPR) repeat protein/2-polyprenyl-3-methyl-5-hydroxy-6-metoxy-1,4-benzoquinol methylase
MATSVAELMRQAMAHHGRGELEHALRLYDDVLARDPDNVDALHLTGVVAHQQGRDEDAVVLISRAIARSPRAPAFRSNLAMALTALGRASEAEEALREALELAPDFSDALLNLGILRAGQGQLEEAVALLERATALDADAPEAHYNLGRARLALGRLPGALDALERSARLGADFAEVHFMIGSAQAGLGNVEEAVSRFSLALDRDADHAGALQSLLEILDGLPMAVDANRLESVVVPLLRARTVNARSLGHATARLLARKHALEVPEGSTPSPQQVCDGLLNDEVARLYLQRTVNVSAPLERLLTACRMHWLGDAAASVMIPQSRWQEACAVAMQCFLNEFVWTVTPEEERAVDGLERRIVDACRPALTPDATLVSDLLVYACYRPLWRMSCAAELGTAPSEAWPAALAELLRACVHEPLRERALQADVVTGATIRDQVSRAVQSQYEENPYPRWSAITRAAAQDIAERVRRWSPRYVAPEALRGRLRVLVAGCGTGMDAIEVALHVNDADVTAIDLSRASLAFAMRKAGEYGLANIRFRQEDILELDASDGPYQFINCIGVLHHMRDPSAGLERLVALLVPRGLIRLAFYSRLARVPLMQAREAIRASGLGSGANDIRAFRRRVFDEGMRGAFAEFTGSTDFYSMSECRDLLFHAHEVQYTLPELGGVLENAGLDFLGFELGIAEVEEGFRREHPDAVMTDLDAWDAYEQRHPHSFRAMYQFWCEKRDA